MLKCSSNAVSVRQPALVPCSSASPRLMSCRAGSRPLPVSVRPRLPSSSSPPALVPCPSASPRLPSPPALVPCPSASALPPSPSRQPPSSSAATIIVATEPSSPPPPPLISCFVSEVPFHIQRNPFGIKQKQKKSIFIIYGTTFKKNKFSRDFQRCQIWNDRSQKQRITAVTHCDVFSDNNRSCMEIWTKS
jgi:hypothetical protein